MVYVQHTYSRLLLSLTPELINKTHILKYTLEEVMFATKKVFIGKKNSSEATECEYEDTNFRKWHVCVCMYKII